MPDVNIDIPFEAYIGDQPYAFIAYAHADAIQVYPVLAMMHAQGYRVWYDEGIDPGNEWPEDIARRLDSCSAFLVFISRNAVTSRNVRNEINFALTRDKLVLAIHIESTPLPQGLELQLGSIQAIQLYRMSSETFSRRLARALDPSLQEAGRPHAVLPQPPRNVGMTTLTKEGLKSLFRVVQSDELDSLSESRKELGLDSSPVATKAAARFIRWLERYKHGEDGYATIGDALASWLTADSGVKQVGESWDIFLQMVGNVLASPELRRGIDVPVYGGPPRCLSLPTSDDWLAFIDTESFQEAIVEDHYRRQRR
jgi:hypothetical protein